MLIFTDAKYDVTINIYIYFLMVGIILKLLKKI